MLQDHLQKLVAFKAIAESASIRKASQVIGIAQPALSRSMQILEADLGIKLFKRSVHGVMLTGEGELLLEYSRRLLKDAEDLQVRLRAGANEISGIVTIGTFASIAIYLWPKILSHLRWKYPALQIHLKTNEDDYMEKLANGELDLIVDAEPRPASNMLSVVLYRDRFNFYAKSEEPYESLPLIFVERSFDENGKTIADYLRANGRGSAASPYDLDSFETVKALVLEGVGVGIMPERVAKDAVGKGLLTHASIQSFPAAGFGSHKVCATIRLEDKKDRRIMSIVNEMKRLLS